MTESVRIENVTKATHKSPRYAQVVSIPVIPCDITPGRRDFLNALKFYKYSKVTLLTTKRVSLQRCCLDISIDGLFDFRKNSGPEISASEKTSARRCDIKEYYGGPSDSNPETDQIRTAMKRMP